MLLAKIKLNKENGSALIMTLVVSLVLVIFSAGMLSLLSTDARGTMQTIRSNSALNTAEAGVEEALWELKFGGADFQAGEGWGGTNPKTKTSTLQTNNGDFIGEYSISVTDPAGNNPKIEVIGYVPNQANTLAKRTVKVFTKTEQKSDFSMAAFGTTNVNFDKEIITDSYNSKNGAYGPGNKEKNGGIGTDSTEAGSIKLSGEGIHIYGDAIVGPGGYPADVIDGETIYGNQVASPTPVNPQPKSVPTGLTVQPDITVAAGKTYTITASDEYKGEYNSIKLGKSATLIINANATLYIKNILDFDKESQLKIPSGKSAQIYLGNVNFSLDKEVAINNESKDPTKFGVYGTSNFTGTIQIKKETEFYGVIHAPNGTIDINKEAKVYGALVARQVTIYKESAIHFDEALKDMGGGSKSYAMTYWQEK